MVLMKTAFALIKTVGPVEYSAPAQGVALGPTIVLGTLVVAFILGVPALAAIALCGHKKPLDSGTALAAGLVGAGLLGWTVFFGGLFGLGVGYALGLALLLGSALVIGRAAGQAAFRHSASALVLAFAACAGFSMCVCAFGFAFGGETQPLATAAMRFSHDLPADNQLPFLVAQGVRAGAMPRPLFIEWLSSDRPPLQTGIYLATAAWWPGNQAFNYQIASVFAQCLSLIGVVMFMAGARARPSALFAALIGLSICGFFLVNAFFVWPKLLSAAFSLVIAAYALTDWPQGQRDNRAAPMLIGAATALALLSHGAAIFGIIGIGLALLARIVLGHAAFPRARFIAIAFACAALVYAPWLAYQKWIDPGGDRLLKFHLAGVEEVDPRPTSEVVSEAYRQIGWTGALRNKLKNVQQAATAPNASLKSAFKSLAFTLMGDGKRARDGASFVRGEQFFLILPALGLFVLGPLIWLGYAVLRIAKRIRTSPDLEIGAFAWLASGLGTIVWAVTLFDGGSAVLHTSGYVLVILAVCGSCMITAAWSRWLALGLAMINALLTIVVYLLYTPSTAAAFGALDHQPRIGLIVLAVACFFACVPLVMRLARAMGFDFVRIVPLEHRA